MAIKDDSLIVGTRGAVFIADAEKQLPDLSKFSLTAETVEGTDGVTYTNIGHTSVDTLPEFSIDGGDSTSHDTWLKTKVRVTYEAVTGTVTIDSVQGDKENLKLIFNAKDMSDGGLAIALDKREQKKAMFIFIVDSDTNQKLGFWIPNASLSYNELPTLNQDDFVEYKMVGDILGSSTLPAADNGDATSIAIYGPEAFATA